MRTAALAGIGVLLVACAAPAAEPSPAASTDPADAGTRLSATILQYRKDAGTGVVQLQVLNAGTAAVTVDRIELDAAGFDGVGPVDKGTVGEVGRAVDLPVPHGRPDCDVEVSAVHVRAWLDGASEPVALPVDGEGVLGRVHDGECAQAEARAALPVSLGPGWAVTGAGSSLVVDGVLRLGPAGNRAVSVRQLDGTTLFAVAPSGLPVQLAAGSGPVDVGVRFAPQRCDPHAIGESKRGYAFGVRLQVDGAREVVLSVSPDDEGRRVLQDALLERCGLAP